MPKLFCTKCNYNFEKDKVPSRCPYCAEDNSVVVQRTAQDILDEVNFERKDIPQ